MEEFDLVVLGGGSGSQVASAAAEAGLDAAVIERGPLGGACVTRGCVPSKALIHRADLLETIRGADRFGVDAAVRDLDYRAVRDEVRDAVFEKAARQERTLREAETITLYAGEGRFVDERTVAVENGEAADGNSANGDEDVDEATENGESVDGGTENGESAGGVTENGESDVDGTEIRGEQVVIAVGARPIVPPIDGLDAVDFLTSTEALWLDAPPERLAVIGGGYVGVELAHFFAAVGTEVSIVGRSDRLLPGEDAVASERVTRALERRCAVYTGYEASAVSEGSESGEVTVTATSVGGTGDSGGDETVDLTADEVLVATGRRPNTDALDLDTAGIETDDRGHLRVDEHLETTVEGVWALGDVLPEHPFKHAADYEARIVARNALAAADVSIDDGDGPDRNPVDYAGMPHAVFADPRVASVGRTGAELDEAGADYESATVEYAAAPLGMIRKEREGVVRAFAGPDGEILGCHVVGADAETMIHEVALAIRAGSGTVEDVAAGIHVHPTMPEVLQAAFVELADDPLLTAPDWRETADE